MFPIEIIFLLSYFVLIICCVYYLFGGINDFKNLSIGISEYIKNIDLVNSITGDTIQEMESIYEGYAKRYPRVKKKFGNFYNWFEIFYSKLYINSKTNYLNDLRSKKNLIDEIYKNIKFMDRYYQCTRYQKTLLKDLENSVSDKVLQNEGNIITKIEDEFVQQIKESRKNEILNKVSIFIGFIGIVFTIIFGVLPLF